jgi:dsDNA-specific endonuclease/ATPase MutS2
MESCRFLSLQIPGGSNSTTLRDILGHERIRILTDDYLKPLDPPADQAEDPEDVVIHSISDSLDLHTFRPGEVKDLLDDYVEAAIDKGFKEVRIIHGKGTGALRQKVHAVLKRHSMVLSYRQADDSSGGWGATVVVLRGKKGC